jgi:DNA-binding beta-propeller fold protein YncE
MQIRAPNPSLLLVCLLVACGGGDASEPPVATVSESMEDAWPDPAGGRLEYRAQVRFGEELEDKSASHAMPAGWKLGRVSGVTSDAEGDVYVLHRGSDADPVVVFDRKGTRMIRSWGRGMFTKPHGIRVDPQGDVWITDVGDHRVLKFSREGRLIFELGERGRAGTAEGSFNRPADIAFGPTGDVYVVDQGEDEERPGLGEPRVVRLSSDGGYLGAWGAPGHGPGEFHFPHSIAVDSRGTVYVSDRENNRVQLFDANGSFIGEWTHLGSTMSLVVTPEDELWMLNAPDNIQILTYDALAGRIMRVDPATGRILGSMASPGHMLDVSASGDLYVASLTGNVFRFYRGWLVERDGGIVAR